MKKILGISAIFIVLGYVISLILGFSLPVKETVIQSSLLFYKFLNGSEIYIKYLPGIIFTAFAVSCCVYFGSNSAGSIERFSSAMMNRFKSIMISSIICTALLTLSSEVFGFLITQKKYNIVNRPKILNEYINVGNTLFEEGYYERALRYADIALKIDPSSRAASDLFDKADVEINRMNNANYRFNLHNSGSVKVSQLEKVDINPEMILQANNCLTMAQEYYDNGDYINAHYYAELGKQVITSKDPNLGKLQYLSASAWNKLQEVRTLQKDENQIIFDQKYKGYLALVQNDDLKAYYIFKNLSEISREQYVDSDIQFYLRVAENRIKDKFFFVDETLELESFEIANDVYFVYSYGDIGKDIFYFKGMNVVGNTGKAIQYLRDLTVMSFDSDGNLFRTMKVPYAKVLPVEVESLNENARNYMGINSKIKTIPYIMLHSVGRDNDSIQILPKYEYTQYNTLEENNLDYIMLPISYEDFIMLEDSKNNPKFMPLNILRKMISKATVYGYSKEIYAQVFLNRVFYPVWMLIILILIGSFAWNNRLQPNQYFKMAWIAGFPVFFLVASCIYQLSMFVFRLINYVMVGTTNSLPAAIIGCSVLYFIGLLFVSLFFLARKSAE